MTLKFPIAETILSQLGGHVFLLFAGAKPFVIPNGLHVRLPQDSPFIKNGIA